MRIFVAALLDPAVIEALTALQNRLRAARADVRWTAEPALHLTLKFVGECPEKGLIPLEAALDGACAAAAPFECEFAGAGAFPDLHRPRILWAGVRAGAREAAALAGLVEKACVDATGCEAETRPYAAHVTIGRVNSPRGEGRLRDLLAAEAETPLGRQTIASIAVVRSDLRREGPIYTVLSEIALSKR